MRALAVLTLALLAACQRGAAPTFDQSDPKAFLQAVYETYYSRAPRQPWTAYRAGVFDTASVGLMQAVEAERTAAGVREPVLEADPLCECLDHRRILTVITVSAVSANAAHADVSLEDHGMKTLRAVALALVRENGVWRIHDITSPYGGTLLGAYAKARADLHDGAVAAQ